MFLLAKFYFVLIILALLKTNLADESESNQQIQSRILRLLRDLKVNVDQTNQAKVEYDARLTQLEKNAISEIQIQDIFNKSNEENNLKFSTLENRIENLTEILKNDIETRITQTAKSEKRLLENRMDHYMDSTSTKLDNFMNSTNIKLKNFITSTNLKVENFMNATELYKLNNTSELMDSKLVDLLTSVNSKFDQVEAEIRNVTQQQASLLANVSSIIQKIEDYHTAKATFYYKENHQGRTDVIDFGNCLNFQKCCKNLVSLDQNAESVHTYDTCILAFVERDCWGISTTFTSGSRNHWDLQELKNKIRSVRPC